MSKKDEVLALLKGSCEGMDKLTDWLVHHTDFFDAPASTKYHGNYPGGLVDHSLNVMDCMSLLNKELRETPFNEDVIVRVALLHDVCKANYYEVDEEPATKPQMNKLEGLTDQLPPNHQRTKGYIGKLIDWHLNGKKEFSDPPAFAYTYKVKDQMPMGHGEKSLFLVQKHIRLSDMEALAIRWHLGFHDTGAHFFFPSGAPLQQAIQDYPLVSLLCAADFLATWQVDVKI